jgi:hypothetical protein
MHRRATVMASFIDFEERPVGGGKYGKFGVGLTRVKVLTPPFKRTASFKDGTSSEKISCGVFNVETQSIQIVDVPKAVEKSFVLHSKVTQDKVWTAAAPVFAVERTASTKEDTRYSAMGAGTFALPSGKTYADLVETAMA